MLMAASLDPIPPAARRVKTRLAVLMASVFRRKRTD